MMHPTRNQTSGKADVATTAVEKVAEKEEKNHGVGTRKWLANHPNACCRILSLLRSQPQLQIKTILSEATGLNGDALEAAAIAFEESMKSLGGRDIVVNLPPIVLSNFCLIVYFIVNCVTLFNYYDIKTYNNNERRAEYIVKNILPKLDNDLLTSYKTTIRSFLSRPQTKQAVLYVVEHGRDSVKLSNDEKFFIHEEFIQLVTNLRGNINRSGVNSIATLLEQPPPDSLIEKYLNREKHTEDYDTVVEKSEVFMKRNRTENFNWTIVYRDPELLKTLYDENFYKIEDLGKSFGIEKDQNAHKVVSHTSASGTNLIETASVVADQQQLKLSVQNQQSNDIGISQFQNVAFTVPCDDLQAQSVSVVVLGHGWKFVAESTLTEIKHVDDQTYTELMQQVPLDTGLMMSVENALKWHELSVLAIQKAHELGITNSFNRAVLATKSHSVFATICTETQPNVQNLKCYLPVAQQSSDEVADLLPSLSSSQISDMKSKVSSLEVIPSTLPITNDLPTSPTGPNFSPLGSPLEMPGQSDDAEDDVDIDGDILALGKLSYQGLTEQDDAFYVKSVLNNDAELEKDNVVKNNQENKDSPATVHDSHSKIKPKIIDSTDLLTEKKIVKCYEGSRTKFTISKHIFKSKIPEDNLKHDLGQSNELNMDYIKPEDSDAKVVTVDEVPSLNAVEVSSEEKSDKLVAGTINCSLNLLKDTEKIENSSTPKELVDDMSANDTREDRQPKIDYSALITPHMTRLRAKNSRLDLKRNKSTGIEMAVKGQSKKRCIRPPKKFSPEPTTSKKKMF